MKENDLLQILKSQKDLLIIQDIDGVCIPLVRDPMNRSININYVKAAKRLHNKFFVLTNGEHEGERGVNRLVEQALINYPDEVIGYYLPGLAAGGIQYQDNYGNLTIDGVSDNEIIFLKSVPSRLFNKFLARLKVIFPSYPINLLENYSRQSIINMQLSPTINLNYIFNLEKDNLDVMKKLQLSIVDTMEEILKEASKQGLSNSFFTHLAPNLGKKGKKEIIKSSTRNDVGTTDIQFMIKGSLKEAGLLVLINKYIESTKGKSHFGSKFNVRDIPEEYNEILYLANQIPTEDIPFLVGIGDTVTSNLNEDGTNYLRGGSDRGFLTLIKDIGTLNNQRSHAYLVDSSFGEVDRPSFIKDKLKGITDEKDRLKFDFLFDQGPAQYINWFIKLSQNI
ncbi:glucosylglycerol 3-phosphatase [Prochlorococcus sp. MIT 1341]|uniref:glucosylglycerol 3-phosphatase n=1 Tax=Prochlorococcus sp. MIT 1341 TaxID=3096221 RepID=UPI002A74766C|nr:glucosylglycerol 3-phosphatase [Prochlorococcus sp. MIT 1341]